MGGGFQWGEGQMNIVNPKKFFRRISLGGSNIFGAITFTIINLALYSTLSKTDFRKPRVYICSINML